MLIAERLKRSLTGNPGARFVHLGNFEVEREWAAGRPRLPGAGVTFTAATVNRLEEMSLFLAEEHDIVLLKGRPDPGFAARLAAHGAGRGRVLCPEVSEPARRVTQDVLASPRLLGDLRALADGSTYLLPLGVSEAEERLAAETGLPLACSGAQVARTVNSKVFSRDLVARTGLRQIPGASCATVDELTAALAGLLRPGGRVVVKEALGVSGLGMVVFDDAARARRFATMVAKRGPAVDVVVEEWIEDATDLNYQFLVGRDGAVTFETVKAAVVESGVHRGHRFPVRLPEAVDQEVRRAAGVIGAELYAHGYTGMVGVDAVLTAGGVLYPCLEINARMNMANYQTAAAERLLPPGGAAEAATVDLQLRAPWTFGDFAGLVKDLLLPPGGVRGVAVTCFATVNAEANGLGSFRGRAGVLCVGADGADARAVRGDLLGRLRAAGVTR